MLAYVALAAGSTALAIVAWVLFRRSQLQRKQLELALDQARLNEETLRYALEAASEYLWDGDLKTGQIVGSQQAGDWLGYPPSEWPPKPWDTIVHEDDRAAVNDAIRKTLRGETPTYRIRHRLRRKDGKVLHALSTGVVVREPSGRPMRFVGFVRDITPEVEEEARRLEAKKLESVGVLARGVAHDFNNLLTVIAASLELATRRSPTDAALTESLEGASRAVARAAELTRQLLAYSGYTHAEHRAIDLNQLLGSMEPLLAVCVRRPVTLRRDLQAGLPAVRGDPTQLQQVVMNLVTNAAEAIGDRDGEIVVSTQRLPEAPARVRLSVKDSGAGMPPEIVARIYEPFFSTKALGRGLGLAAVSGIVKGHRGTVALQSAPGQGTIAHVDLPAIEAPALAPAPAPVPVSQPSAKPTRLGLRVLLVDDEPVLRKAARRLLESLGCKLEEAADGRAAIEKVKADPAAFDVVLMDVMMPDIGGIEAAETLRKVVPGLPVVLSSGFSEAPLPSRDGLLHLAKPYTARELDAVLRAATKALTEPPSPP